MKCGISSWHNTLQKSSHLGLGSASTSSDIYFNMGNRSLRDLQETTKKPFSTLHLSKEEQEDNEKEANLLEMTVKEAKEELLRLHMYYDPSRAAQMMDGIAIVIIIYR
ncbi:hypothetical protein LSM04_007390 [Trypanosoma melophagium]|uniref:uncharacterized protein n=1 Tax=Trypanosoma melophagium TaxID=715481 RepID=UPI00351A5F01|nr:hypothetical protein LSM04_007390 [Trypanosoma melophagium]